MITLTPEQEVAAYAPYERYLVRAAAGTGKTTVLTARYLWLVKEKNVSPEKLVTVTFSRAAAAEMKSRIVTQLRTEGLREAAQAAETGPIQTIHSICQRILQENALLANLDPALAVIDDLERNQVRFRCFQTAIYEALSDENNPANRTILEQIAGENDYRGADKLMQTLGDIEQVLYGRLAPSPDYLNELVEPERLKALWWRTLASREELPHDTEPFSADPIRAADLAKLNAEAQTTATLVRILRRAQSLYRAELEDRQELDFQLLEQHALDLVLHNPDVQERLRTQIDHVLVDEAQDLSEAQNLLIDALPAQTVMMVGDAQQLIYGFRGAAIERFRQRSNDWHEVQLTINQRSTAALQRFNNLIFSQALADDHLPFSPDGPVNADDPFDLDTPSTPHIEAEGVYLLEAADKALPAEGIAEFIADWIAEDPQQPLGRIAVLCHFRSDLSKIEAALEKRGIPSRFEGGNQAFFDRAEVLDAANLLAAAADPLDDFALSAVLLSPFVGLTLDSYVLLARETPLWSALTEFQPPFEHDRKLLDHFQTWFSEVIENAARGPAWEVLQLAHTLSPYLRNCAERPDGERVIANARKLLRAAAKNPEMGARTFSETIRQAKQLSHTEGDAAIYSDPSAAVSLATIHHSKGLSYDWTIVIPPTLRSRRAPVGFFPGHALPVASFAKSPIRDYVSKARESDERQEIRRLTYVALTRARQRLALVIPFPEDRRNQPVVIEEIRRAASLSRGIQTVPLRASTPPANQ